jgi:DNA-binding transcriptional ArsR family regulator
VTNDNPNGPTKRKRRALAKVEPIDKKQKTKAPSEDEREKIPYHYTPIPSKVIRAWFPVLDPAAIRVYVCIADHTRGYRREWDEISISQFCEGRKDRNGATIDAGTGLSRSAVKKGLESLYALGLIRIIRCKTKANLYALTHPLFIEAEAEAAKNAEAARRASMPANIGQRHCDKRKRNLEEVAG